MITKEEFEKAVEFCTNADENCAGVSQKDFGAEGCQKKERRYAR